MSLPPPPPVQPASSAPSLPRCYRHPDREAGRSCTRCGKSACSECLVQAAVGSHCVDCAKAARPDVATRAKYWNARQHTLVTYVVMAINIAVFVYTSIDDPSSMAGRSRVTDAQAQLGLIEFVMAAEGDWYRLVTSGFLHFGVIHLAFNMLLLYQLGQLLERSLDRAKFVLLYAACLLGGSFGVLLITDNPFAVTGGASGAVFGLMAAAAVGLQRQGVSIFSTGLGTTLLLNFFITFTIPGISIGGHVGGAVAGAICGFVMMAPRWRPVPSWARWGTPVAVGFISVVGSVLLVG